MLISLYPYITDYSSDTVALLSCHITFKSLVSRVCIQWNYCPYQVGISESIFFNLISGPSLMDSAYDKYNYAKNDLQNSRNNAQYIVLYLNGT
jgi:hypothetical protein